VVLVQVKSRKKEDCRIIQLQQRDLQIIPQR